MSLISNFFFFLINANYTRFRIARHRCKFNKRRRGKKFLEERRDLFNLENGEERETEREAVFWLYIINQIPKV